MAAPQPVILLPPSEGKAAGGSGPSWSRGSMTDSALDPARATVLRAARATGATPRRAPTLPAFERYTGVLYRELAWPSLPAPARRRGDQQVRVVSGLWGLAAPGDPIPPYRLKMSASLEGLGRLASWWRPRLPAALAPLVDDAVVWDLLPQEHQAAVDWSACSPRQRVVVRFVDAEGKAIAHWNKLLKGALVRWLLVDRPAGPVDLARFRHPLGYRLDRGASTFDGEAATAVLRAAP